MYSIDVQNLSMYLPRMNNVQTWIEPAFLAQLYPTTDTAKCPVTQKCSFLGRSLQLGNCKHSISHLTGFLVCNKLLLCMAKAG